LVERQLATLPVVLDGEGDDAATDPLLAGRPDLARFYRLGDLLRDAGHHKAALIEYAKAQDPKAPPSPLLLSREALCYEALGQLPQALGLTREGTALYPEFTLLQKTHGRLLRATGDDRAAITAYQAAHDLNPFDPEVERALVDLHQRTGHTTLAARHLAALRVLETSGAANAPPSNP
jgi:tetratricopeptide (TPR) repeat protein